MMTHEAVCRVLTRPVGVSITRIKKLQRAEGYAVWEANLGRQVGARWCRVLSIKRKGDFCHPFVLTSMN